MTRREAFDLLQSLDYVGSNIDVCELHCSAAQNAADTVGHANRFDANGQFTDEFVSVWYESVSTLLAAGDRPAAVVEWYEAHGFTY